MNGHIPIVVKSPKENLFRYGVTNIIWVDEDDKMYGCTLKFLFSKEWKNSSQASVLKALADTECASNGDMVVSELIPSQDYLGKPEELMKAHATHDIIEGEEMCACYRALVPTVGTQHAELRYIPSNVPYVLFQLSDAAANLVRTTSLYGSSILTYTGKEEIERLNFGDFVEVPRVAPPSQEKLEKGSLQTPVRVGVLRNAPRSGRY